MQTAVMPDMRYLFATFALGTMALAAVAVNAEERVNPTERAITTNGFFTAQQANQMLASNLLNTMVHGSEGDHIGDVEDILLDSDGRAIGIVVGVGGFLGIAQHDVAINLAEVEFILSTGAENGMLGRGYAGWDSGQVDSVRVPFTRIELEAAPNFETLDTW